MELLSYKLAATTWAHAACEMEYILYQSRTGCTWQKTRPNLLLLVVNNWVLVIPRCWKVWNGVLLQQQVTACQTRPNKSFSMAYLGDLQATL